MRIRNKVLVNILGCGKLEKRATLGKALQNKQVQVYNGHDTLLPYMRSKKAIFGGYTIIYTADKNLKN